MKYLLGLMLASFTMFTYAQRTPLACQENDAAGLNWEAGKWSVRRFISDKFILVKEGSSLTTESVAKALDSLPAYTKCEVQLIGHVMCHTITGKSMYFSYENNKGGISALFGTTMNSADRDSVVVRAFTCSPF